MRIEEVRIFAPGYSVDKIMKKTLYDPSELSQAFRTRINEFYLNPAKFLSAFAQGVLCFTLIDFLANIIITDVSQVQDYREFIKNHLRGKSFPNKKLTVEDRIITFLVKEIKVLTFEYGYYFYKYVRNGLIHEGRIKCGCYLDNKIGGTFQDEKGVLVFNPNMILQKLDSWIKTYLQKIENGGNTYKNLKNYIRKMLCEDSKAIKKRFENKKFPC